jgi:hypothetical protein
MKFFVSKIIMVFESNWTKMKVPYTCLLLVIFFTLTIQEEYYPNWMELDFEKIKNQTVTGSI